MIGDKIVIQDIHCQKANILFPLITKKYKQKFIVALGGESGTGKTEIATLLQSKLWEEKEIKVKIIHIDDYYCVDGESLVLMSDYRSKKLKDVKVGDEILTFTENGVGNGRNKYRKFIKSKVIKSKYKGKKETIEIIGDEKLRITPDHNILLKEDKERYPYNWVNFVDKNNKKYQSAKIPFIKNESNYFKGFILGLVDSDGTNKKFKQPKPRKDYFRRIWIYQKNYIKEVEKVLNKLKIQYKTSELQNGVKAFRIKGKYFEKIDKWYKELIITKNKDILYGYLSGFVLGDGSITKNDIFIYQNENKFFDRIIKILKKLNINYNILGKTKCKTIRFKKISIPLFNNPKYYNMLNSTLSSTNKQKVKINYNKKIIDVYDITTTAGTFIANGFIVHNCTNWQERNKIREKRGIDSVGAKEIDWFKLDRIFKRFKSDKRKLYVQRIHRFTNSLEYVIAQNRSIDVLLFEGLYACYNNKTDLKIYLQGSMKDTYQFRKERGKENPDDNLREKILVKESIDVRKTKKKANIIVDWNGNIEVKK